ncbi:adhesion G-protein coupled receptor D2 [Trichosurus vulpecula]|uniref:adhesion G-protein coupled receptor D2 n=1 Tax=Trichosurus vulpecula TaxID=9337 RepID=UPI00186AE087|nr:adhesion G-protein coupled receptor D2 [Trichosurus vulpecula]
MPGRLSWFLFLLIGSLSWNPSSSSASLKTLELTAPGASSAVETPNGVYEVKGGQQLDWRRAHDFCDQRFAQLALEPQDGAVTELLQRQVQGPIWVGQRTVLPQRPQQRRTYMLPCLVFEMQTATKYARLLVDFPMLAAITVCTHIQWDLATDEVGTVFSYAAPAFANELQLRGFTAHDGVVHLALVVHGHHSPYLPVFSADGRWHHVCATWEERSGQWALVTDGKLQAGTQSLSPAQSLAPGGMFVIGQDQDSLGGGFKKEEAFRGNITNLYVWAQVLGLDQLDMARVCEVPEDGLLFGWSRWALEIESTLQEVVLPFKCPVPIEECPTLDASNGTLGSEQCLRPLPFLCHYRTEVYWRLKEVQKTADGEFISRVNTLANTTMLSRDGFREDPGSLSMPEATSFLGVLEQVLAAEETPLQPADLLAVVSFLKRVVAVEVRGQDPPGQQEHLSQNFLAVVGLLLEEQTEAQWLEIKEIIRSPMVLVESVNRIATSLSLLLTAERPNISIQKGPIGIEARSLNLRDLTSGDLLEIPGGPEYIQVPFEEVRRLQGRGLSRVTVINTWFVYSALQHSLGWEGQDGGKVLSQNVSISDERQKYLSTQVGSAIISSTVLVNLQEISTAVHYHLLHRTQGFSDKLVEPVCAFWNFSSSPEAGGSWSSKGCSVIAQHPGSTSCFCNHSTNFAILLQVYDIQRSSDEESVLKTLSFIGCGVSFCALITTFILFLAVGLPQSERTTVHKNLILALAAAEALLMFSEWAKAKKAMCMVLTAFLHLFFMAAFTWMLVEGLLLWSKVVAVNRSEDQRMKFYYMIGWGIPVVIVGVTLASSFDGYMADHHCWLSLRNGVIWAFAGPVLFVLTVNTFILFRVVIVTVSSARRRSRMLSPQHSLERQIGVQIWATVKPVLVLLPVLGLTWLGSMLAHLSMAWAYVSIILNSFQGLYIFLVYAVYNSEVRLAIQRMKEKKKALLFTVSMAPLLESSLGQAQASRGICDLQNCSRTINYPSSPRNTASWETKKGNPPGPTSSISAPAPATRTPPQRSIIHQGNLGAKIPGGFSPIMSSEKSMEKRRPRDEEGHKRRPVSPFPQTPKL